MPLTEKGKKIMSSMKDTYGKEKGEQVFYASRNAGKIKDVDPESSTDKKKKDKEASINTMKQAYINGYNNYIDKIAQVPNNKARAIYNPQLDRLSKLRQVYTQRALSPSVISATKPSSISNTDWTNRMRSAYNSFNNPKPSSTPIRQNIKSTVQPSNKPKTMPPVQYMQREPSPNDLRSQARSIFASMTPGQQELFKKTYNNITPGQRTTEMLKYNPAVNQIAANKSYSDTYKNLPPEAQAAYNKLKSLPLDRQAIIRDTISKNPNMSLADRIKHVNNQLELSRTGRVSAMPVSA